MVKDQVAVKMNIDRDKTKISSSLIMVEGWLVSDQAAVVEQHLSVLISLFSLSYFLQSALFLVHMFKSASCKKFENVKFCLRKPCIHKKNLFDFF